MVFGRDHDDGKDVTITDINDVVINVESYVIQDMKCPFPFPGLSRSIPAWYYSILLQLHHFIIYCSPGQSGVKVQKFCHQGGSQAS